MLSAKNSISPSFKQVYECSGASSVDKAFEHKKILSDRGVQSILLDDFENQKMYIITEKTIHNMRKEDFKNEEEKLNYVRERVNYYI